MRGEAAARVRTQRAGAEAARRDRVRQVVEPVVAAAGCDLEDLTLSRAGRRHLLRVVIDADGGVSLDDVAEVSRAVSAALDAAEEVAPLFDGEYSLEVGSPGVDRPLRLPRHWRRSVGRLVRVAWRAGEGERQLTARVLAATAEVVELEVDGQRLTCPYAELGPGRVQVEFRRLDEVDEADLEECDDDEEGDQR